MIVSWDKMILYVCVCVCPDATAAVFVCVVVCVSVFLYVEIVPLLDKMILWVHKMIVSENDKMILCE